MYRSNPNKGAAQTIGLVILLATAIIVSVVAVGAVSEGNVSTLQDRSEADSSEDAFSKISSSSVSSGINGERSSEAVSLKNVNQDNPVELSESSTVRVWSEDDNGNTQEILEENIGYISYNVKDDETLYYENGGVWKINARTNSVKTITTPEFNYSERTLTLPLIKLTGENKSYSEQLRFSSESTPNATANQTVIEDEIVYIQVQSPAYLGWGEYFKNRINSKAVTYDHGDNTVVMELGLGGEKLSSFENATISSSNLETQGKPTINGDVEVGGSIDDKSVVNGSVQPQNQDLLEMDSFTNSRIAEIKSEGDKKDGSDLGGETLKNGDYYVENLSITNNSEELTVNLSQGDVNIAVDGDLTINNNTGIKVVSPNQGDLEVYVDGDITMAKGSPYWTVESGDSSSNIVYAPSDSTITLGQNSVFTGVLYAPSNPENSTNTKKSNGGGGGPNKNAPGCKQSTATFCMGTNSSVNGAVVTGSAEMKNNSEINYDTTNLENFEITYDQYEFSRPELSYLHTSITEVQVDGGN